jgi:hypothetical protein
MLSTLLLPEAGAWHERTRAGGTCEQASSSFPILDLDVPDERQDA